MLAIKELSNFETVKVIKSWGFLNLGKPLKTFVVLSYCWAISITFRLFIANSCKSV